MAIESDLITLLALQRQIFGVCPQSGIFFRLSDCKIFLKRRPLPDWMDELEREESLLALAEDRLSEKEEGLRKVARLKGRRLARQTVEKIDTVFSPKKLNPDDAKVIFNPIDYIVFNGMKQPGGHIKNIILLDGQAKKESHPNVQRSIKRAVAKRYYEWQTLRIRDSGQIEVV